MFIAIVEFIALAIIFGEIRLLTNSVWPPLLMHTVYNAFAETLAVQGVVKIAPGMEYPASPGPGGPMPILFLMLVGVGLHRLRTGKQITSRTSQEEPVRDAPNSHPA